LRRRAHLFLLELAVGAAMAVTAPPTAASEAAAIVISVRTNDPGTPFPHFWEQMFGSGRAALALRDNYRRDMRLVKGVTELSYVRFHAIFHDEVGLYDLDAKGNVLYNFSYVDQIYDGLLTDGVRPYVELGYGIDEVAQWYFEVWNEPNIDFWGGTPPQSTYYELYDHTARAIKKISTRLRVGGPSTAQAAWAGDFIEHCKQTGVPIDFVSSHVYANDTPHDVFKNSIPVPRDKMVCRAVRKVSDEIKHSSMPLLPLIFSEYNASYANEPDVTDTVYMGPWLATTISQCDGLTRAMSYWTFSDVFEEGGVVKTPFYGGFGIVAEHDIPKPAFNAFALLHRLGQTRVAVDSDSALATRRPDGTLVLALWNYAPPDGTGAKYVPPAPAGAPTEFLLDLSGMAQDAHATIWRLDQDHGNVIKVYDAMGRPPFPSREQIAMLQAAAQLAAPETVGLIQGQLQLSVPTQGLAVIEVR
jgi:xylan 1,4-beta-xylosidase